ncbi:unnamed protein product [Brassica oleracea var. botrytis]|uniref:Uncharacterized protein n=2 Tax=Brassica TaxID=3705 RepID=A0A3P6CND9_BRAOL|nr:unnamed protein product [Brassica napus]CDY13218.1 BnaC04g26170D [Brassica napus]VDD09912.1 unnamed protein product [Brassica oleracea]
MSMIIIERDFRGEHFGSLNNVMVCGFTSRGIGLHKVAKFENEQ